jgi:cellulose synthase/poly-beta-1,6-N-acetylglucosamine synthase-like glycosyltransferase
VFWLIAEHFTVYRVVSPPARKDIFVQRSLSVLLPVKDAQSTLNASVHDILDVMSDTIERFEVLIIDDGSIDATSEVAQELTRHYPQVRVVHHGTSLGHEAALRTGIKRSQGEVVVIQDGEKGFRILEHRKPGSAASSRPARPNFLGRLKGLVGGE